MQSQVNVFLSPGVMVMDFAMDVKVLGGEILTQFLRGASWLVLHEHFLLFHLTGQRYGAFVSMNSI